MMNRMSRLIPAVLTAGVLVVTVAACSTPTTPTDGKVEITVGGMPTADKPELLTNFNDTVEAFEEANPNITVVGDETVWAADTFQSLIAGGTMPTTLDVPFTEIQGLIARGQVAEIGAFLEESETLSSLNPSVVDVVSTDDGVWGIPWGAYTMGLVYNRGLFEQAGLDPDSPPQTWDEVREAAKAIEASTDAQGFQSMTLENTGGWVLQAMSNAFGGSFENPDGTEATVDNDGTRAALEFYQDLRWDDNTFGSNFLLNYGDAHSALAAGQAGMMVAGADGYNNLVTNLGMAPEDFGVAPLPQGDDGIGTLGGGTIAIFDPKASADEVEAATKWVEFWRFTKYTDEEFAVEQAKTQAEANNAVGYPALPVVDAALQDQYLEWVAEYINVPRENYELYLSTVESVPIVPEPAVKAQEVYAALDVVVQAVLTREDADIDALLSEAQATVDAILAG